MLAQPRTVRAGAEPVSGAGAVLIQIVWFAEIVLLEMGSSTHTLIVSLTDEQTPIVTRRRSQTVCAAVKLKDAAVAPATGVKLIPFRLVSHW